MAGFSTENFSPSATFYYRPGALGWGFYNFDGRFSGVILPAFTVYESKETNNAIQNSLRFGTLPGINYYVQKSSDLSDWSTKANFVGGGSEKVFFENSTNARAFYRLLPAAKDIPPFEFIHSI